MLTAGQSNYQQIDAACRAVKSDKGQAQAQFLLSEYWLSAKPI